MSFWRLVWKSLTYHRKVNGAVALGVAAAAAVLTGALLVGTSMRGSLRDLTLQRLNRVDELLMSRTFFDMKLVEQIKQTATFEASYEQAEGAIFFPSASMETIPPQSSTGSNEDSSKEAQEDRLRRTGNVQILGIRESGWSLGGDAPRPKRLPESGEVILNEAAAEGLGLKASDVENSEVLVTLRLPKPQAVPSDSPLGEKEDLILNLPRLKVIEIVPNRGLGRFGLHPSQLVSKSAFVNLEQVQEALEQYDRINMVLLASKRSDQPPAAEVTSQLAGEIRPGFEDYGLLLKRVTQTSPDGESVFDYWSVSSSEMVLTDEIVEALRPALETLQARPALTYLANDLATFSGENAPDGKHGTPFSMVAGIDFDADYAPRSSVTGEPIAPLESNEIVLNEWAAQDMQASVGDLVRLTYFEPETTHGLTDETHHDFVVKDIAKLTTPASPYNRARPAKFDESPTLANDPDLTPDVPGVTDQQSIENWDLPFQTADRIESEDDLYWRNYRTTPKAFVGLEPAQDLWQSRFGKVTSLRIPAGELDESAIKAEMLEALHAAEQPLGFTFASVKREGLKSASGTTPFDGLFLGLSLFIIVSALMLVVLLFKLGLEQRASEAGVLMAVGYDKRRVSRLFACESLLVASIGGLLGVGIGIAYAALMIYGLKTWWVGAIRTPFIELHVDAVTLLLGYFVSLFVCGATIVFTVWRFKPAGIRTLLTGKLESSTGLVQGPKSWWKYVAAGFAVVAGIGAVAASVAPLSGESQAGAFMGSGAMLLTAMLIFVWYGLKSTATRDSQSLDLKRLSYRNASRNSTRSTLTIGLVASASFLVGSISAFRLAPTDTGTGGFDLLMSTSRPIFVDFNDEQVLTERFGGDAEKLGDLSAIAFRLKRGDDASCNNPYQVAQPRVLGVDDRVVEWFDDPNHGSFAFAGVLSDDSAVQDNPWRVLESAERSDDAIPVILDKNTAMWSLKVYSLGQDFVIDYDGLGPVTFRPVGFLSNSVLQGSLIVSDRDFRKLFPEISGDQFFLAATATEDGGAAQDEIRGVLEAGLGDEGLTTERTTTVLSDLLAVQNTYLTTFQSLGALGLLLGTFGLATVQLRNVLERRAELGLMRAIGFPKQRLGRLVLLENSYLLLGGLGIGALASVFVVLPHMIFGDASVPWATLAVLLAVIIVVGLLTGLIAVRASLRITIQQALREE